MDTFGKKRQRIQHIVAPVSLNSDKFIKYGSLVVLVLQNASHVLIMRYVTTRQMDMFFSTVAVFMGEVVKLIVSLLLICWEEKVKSFSVMFDQIIMNPIDTFKVFIPATIYVAQNNLMYVAISNLPAATYMVSYQGKILTTALFSVLILRRKLSIQQWFALIFLLAGVAIVQVGENNAKATAKLAALNATLSLSNMSSIETSKNISSEITTLNLTKESDHLSHLEQNPFVGFIAVVIACFLSGFGGIYLEKILKTSPSISVWMRNIQLSIISLPISLVNIYVQDRIKVMENGFFFGFDIMVVIMIFLYSLGGLTVAVVMKFADNILKAFATSISIIAACIASVFIFSFKASFIFLVGTALVIGAVMMYSIFPYKKKRVPVENAVPEKEKLTGTCQSNMVEMKPM